MKRLFFVFMIILGAAWSGKAQDYVNQYTYARHREYYVDAYREPFFLVNGFRTVEEENRLMEQTLAEMRRQRDLEEMTPAERASSQKRKEIKQEIKNDRVAAQKEKQAAKSEKPTAANNDSIKSKKPAAAKKDSVKSKKQ